MGWLLQLVLPFSWFQATVFITCVAIGITGLTMLESIRENIEGMSSWWKNVIKISQRSSVDDDVYEEDDDDDDLLAEDLLELQRDRSEGSRSRTRRQEARKRQRHARKRQRT
jgi:hypothetical protein